MGRCCGSCRYIDLKHGDAEGGYRCTAPVDTAAIRASAPACVTMFLDRFPMRLTEGALCNHWKARDAGNIDSLPSKSAPVDLY